VPTRFWRYLLVPIVYLFALFLTFRGYATGSAVPPWDFMGGGHVEALRWYQDGNLLKPPGWFPYAWFGLPEHQLIQNGGWVVPIALTAEIFGWSPRHATLVQGGFIWFGGVSAFALSRAFRWQWPVSFLVGFIYLFSVMNISNAQHSAMLRAAALLPLLMLVCLPAWVLKSPWLVIVGGLVWWQVLVSSYPGNLIPILFLVLLVVAISCVRLGTRSRSKYLLTLLVTAFGGFLLAAPRWVPVLVDRQSFPVERENTAILTWELIPTLISSYDLPGLPNDVTMRSIWLAPLCLGALFLLRRKNSLGVAAAGVMAIALLMMSEIPGIAQLKDVISIFRVSTFAISDWRPILVLAAAVLVGSVLQDAFTSKWLSKRDLYWRGTMLLLAGCGVLAIEWARSGGVRPSLLLYLLALITCATLCVISYRGISEASAVAGVVVLAMLTFTSFNLLASTANRTWQTDRQLAEAYVFSGYFDEIEESNTWPLISRPARWYMDFPPLDYAAATADARYNRYWVTGEFGAVGNHNVKFSSVYQAIIEQLDAGATPLVNFLSTSSRQLIMPPSTSMISDNDLTRCASDATDCNPNSLEVEIEMKKFDKEGEIFLISAKEAFTMVQNEAFHPGWTYSLCPSAENLSACVPSGNALVVNEALRAWQLPAGNYQLVTFYVTPGEPYRWLLSGVGVGMLFGFPLLARWRIDSHSRGRF